MTRRVTTPSAAQSMRSRWTVACVAAIVVPCLAAGSAVAAPATDEYTLRLPDAGGNRNVGPGAPKAQPAELPAAVRDQLAKSPDQAAPLAEIATADALGAPPPAPAAPAQDLLDDDSTEGRSLPEAALSALTDPLALAILLGLGGITAAIVLRSRAGGGPSPEA